MTERTKNSTLATQDGPRADAASSDVAPEHSQCHNHDRTACWNATHMVIFWQVRTGHGNLNTANREKDVRKSHVANVFVHDLIMAGRTESPAPTWSQLKKKIEMEDPTLFIDQVYRHCKPREADNKKNISRQTINCSRGSPVPKFSTETWETHKNSRVMFWSYDLKGHDTKVR